jgi:hypothetical protein
MGFQIALTGLIIAIVGLLFGMLSWSQPRQIGLSRFFGSIMLLGVFTIPIGLIIQIWQ